jgi:hypothetical protein
MEKQKEKDIPKHLLFLIYQDQEHMIYLIMLKDLVIVYPLFIQLQKKLLPKMNQLKVMKNYLKKIIGM